jgi:hypothetical protein
VRIEGRETEKSSFFQKSNWPLYTVVLFLLAGFCNLKRFTDVPDKKYP